MASSKDYLQFILEQLSDLEEITYRAMMGEYILYYRGKIVGGIYDDRLLVKPIKSAVSYMPEAAYELPYEGAKEMLFVDNVDDKEFLAGLFRAMYDEFVITVISFFVSESCFTSSAQLEPDSTMIVSPSDTISLALAAIRCFVS